MKCKVQKIGEREFLSVDAADKFIEEIESQGFDAVSRVTNTPRVGMCTVSWGHYIESTESAHEWELRTISDIYNRREKEAANEFTAKCNEQGREEAAKQQARAAGYAGRDAEVFELGFRGWSAKFANPRAEGREHIFREGRRAWGSAEGQRLTRIETVKERSCIARVEPVPFNVGRGLIANGEF
jgi:hypothetical protein